MLKYDVLQPPASACIVLHKEIDKSLLAIATIWSLNLSTMCCCLKIEILPKWKTSWAVANCMKRKKNTWMYMIAAVCHYMEHILGVRKLGLTKCVCVCWCIGWWWCGLWCTLWVGDSSKVSGFGNYNTTYHNTTELTMHQIPKIGF